MVVGFRKEYSFCLNSESFSLFAHGQDQLFISRYSTRLAHAGYDVTGDRHLQSIWYLFDGHPLQPGGNSRARRWCPHFLAPAAALGAAISVKQLLLSKTQQSAFQFLKRWATNGSEWSFITPIWLLHFFFNFFQPQLPNAHRMQHGACAVFCCARSYGLPQPTCIAVKQHRLPSSWVPAFMSIWIPKSHAGSQIRIENVLTLDLYLAQTSIRFSLLCVQRPL